MLAPIMAPPSSLLLNPSLPSILLHRSSLPPLSFSIRSSASSEGPIRRPSIPVKEATSPSPSPSPSPASTPPPPVSSSSSSSSSSSVVTVEYQRQRAKELQEYFLDRKYEKQAADGRIFGWNSKNEINNGRWAMFGIAVGLLTEYATGSDFVDQLKIIVSNLGIADLE